MLHRTIEMTELTNNAVHLTVWLQFIFHEGFISINEQLILSFEIQYLFGKEIMGNFQ